MRFMVVVHGRSLDRVTDPPVRARLLFLGAQVGDKLTMGSTYISLFRDPERSEIDSGEFRAREEERRSCTECHGGNKCTANQSVWLGGELTCLENGVVVVVVVEGANPARLPV